MQNPVFEIIDDFDIDHGTSVAQAVAQQERAFNRTQYSNVLLAVEKRRRRLCVLKASKCVDDPGDTIGNQRALENEAAVLQRLSSPGHRHLGRLLPVSEREYIAKDKDTGVYFLAEPYYAGYTLADLINPLPAWEELGQHVLRWINYRLLTFTVALGKHPSSRKLLPGFLPIDDPVLMPSNKIYSSGKPLPVTDAIEIATNIADLLAYLHQYGVVHCDLKPSNVLYKRIQWPGWRDHKQLVVVDFGAAVKDGEAATAGTLRWSAPEQQSCPAAHAMDLYALGKILAYLLTGQIPALPESTQPEYQLQQKTAAAVAAASPTLAAEHLRFPWYMSRKERAACTQKINVLVSDLTAEDPAARVRSAREVLKHLKEIRTMTTKRLGVTYMLMGILIAGGLLLTISPGVRTDIEHLAKRVWPAIVAPALAKDNGASSPLVGDDLDPTTAATEATASIMGFGPGGRPAAPPAVRNVIPPQPSPGPVPTVTSALAAALKPTATATPTALPTPTPTLTPTPTATSVVLARTRVAPPKVGVSIVEYGDTGLQRCLQEGADTFGRQQVKFRIKLEGNVVRPQFEVEVRGGDLSGSRTAVGRQPAGSLFHDLGDGVYQFDGKITCDIVGCNPSLVYQWRLNVTDGNMNQRGISNWCNFKFEKP